jgi:hypothetical protein
MNTRHQPAAGPLSQERYMSSNEFAELRGISGIAVSARAAVLLNARKRNLVWFIQGLSLAEGGLNRVARELLEMFPDRIGTPAMRKAGVKPEKMYPDDLLDSVKYELMNLSSQAWLAASMVDEPVAPKPQRPPASGAELIEKCRSAALLHREKSSRRLYASEATTLSLEEFLIDLCINPRIHFPAPGEPMDVADIETDRAIELNRELNTGDFQTANLVYFRDIIGALFEYQTRYEAAARAKFQPTTISKKVWETLDYGLSSRGMVLLDGLEGRGKTESVKAWCALHLGQARFISLKGVTNKTTVFREIAKALGIASSYTRTATDMQARIEDVLKRSKIMLVMDEAHFLFHQGHRMYARPELIDWIDTAVCNCGVPIAMVTTPQFIKLMTRAADQVEWNYRQFRRRVRRWIKLPAVNTEDDIKAVARSVFKTADAATIKKIAGYALLSKRDLSAVGDVANEVRDIIGTDDLSQATVEHVTRAIYERLLPSDQTFLEGMAAARAAVRKGRPPRLAPPAPALPDPAAAAPTGDDASPDPAPGRLVKTPARGGALELPATGRRAEFEPALTGA